MSEVRLLSEIVVRPLERREEPRYQARMAAHHYLGALPKIGETLWGVATWQGRWLAQIGLFQKPNQNIPEMMRQLARRPRQVLDYLRLTANSAPAPTSTA